MEASKRECGGCNKTYTVYGPLITKPIYRCYRCESNPIPSARKGTGRIPPKPNLDQTENRVGGPLPVRLLVNPDKN